MFIYGSFAAELHSWLLFLERVCGFCLGRTRFGELETHVTCLCNLNKNCGLSGCSFFWASRSKQFFGLHMRVHVWNLTHYPITAAFLVLGLNIFSHLKPSFH